MLNKYERVAKSLIAEKQKIPLHLIVNRNKEPATWDDHHWTISNLNGSKKNFPLFNILLAPNLRAKFIPIDVQYPDTERHLLMCYLLALRNLRDVTITTGGSISAARHLLARVNVCSLSQQALNDLYELHKRQGWLTKLEPFIIWLKEQGIVSQALKTHPIEGAVGREDGDTAQAKRERNMPDERVLWALGAIRNEIIPSSAPKGIYQRHLSEELIVSGATLGLAAPMRAAKEQFAAQKTTLQSKMVTFDGKEQKVHWVDWPGSKGYQANKKHFFRSVATPASEVLNYWNEVGEPARILCRFYEKPTLPLRELMGNYQPANLAKFDINKPIDNLFVLGYLLGFYEGQEQTVTLTPGRKSARGKPTKHIQDLTLTDKVIFGPECSVLFGTADLQKNNNPKETAYFKGLQTIAQLQEKWLRYVKQQVPTFPKRVVGANEVTLNQALFIATGAQLSTGRAGAYPLGTSYFAIESIDMSHKVKAGLRNSKGNTIFTRYGFSADISLNQYQLRHWKNTMMQKSLDISPEVIAMVSSRKDIRHNAEYDNRTDDEKMQPVRRLFTKERTFEELQKEVRVISHQKYQEATGKIATITGTGICTQQLTVNPCTYLNDFETHCALCSSSTHFAHDEKAILLLESDLKAQKIRLTLVGEDDYLYVNTELQAWFKIHHRNTILLEQLIALMKREDLEVGTAIKYVGSNNSFRLTDLEKRKTDMFKALLPDSTVALNRLIEAKKSPVVVSKNEQALSDLLSQFGVK